MVRHGKSNKFDCTNRRNEGADLGKSIGDAALKELEKTKKDAARQANKARKVSTGSLTGGENEVTGVHSIDLVAPSKALTDEGVYAVNLIDHPPLAFVRAELATLREVFPHVALLARRPVLAGEDGGNVVAVASRTPIPVDAISAALPGFELAWVLATGPALDEFIGDAAVLTDDFAPVDQLIGR